MFSPDQTQPPSSAPAFPSSILQAAEVYQLGNPLAQYRPKYTPARAMLRGVGKVVLALALSIAIMVIILVGVTQMAQSPSSLVILLPLGLAFTALILPFRVGRAASADYRHAVELQAISIYLCTDGILRIEQPQGAAPIIIALRWDRILTITQLMAKRSKPGAEFPRHQAVWRRPEQINGLATHRGRKRAERNHLSGNGSCKEREELSILPSSSPRSSASKKKLTLLLEGRTDRASSCLHGVHS